MFDSYDDIITVEEACDILKIGKNSIYSLLNSGKLKAFQMGRTWKIPKIAVEEYIIRMSRTELR